MLLTAAFGMAAELKGTVVNGTTGKPASGDEVALLRLSQDGMSETARTRADDGGHFHFPLTDQQTTYVVRAIHQGVTYHNVAKPGIKNLVLEVYDVANQLADANAIMDVERFEATDDTLEVKHLITVRNNSKPPRTLMNDHTFEIQLPTDARVQSGLVQVEDGPPLKQKPIAGGQKGQYYFVFPIRPGDTRFAVIYQRPYNGEALITPVIRNPGEKFVVMLPQSMQFMAQVAGTFQTMPGTTPDNVLGSAPMTPGQSIAFQIAGVGTLQELQGRREGAQSAKSVPSTRPGGGIGPPIDAPDPLQKYRVEILGGLIGLVAIFAAYTARKTSRAEKRQSRHLLLSNRRATRARTKSSAPRSFAKRS
jgi:5-hydroxyisourate hydrolase-like protein (transthyretin family)